MCDLVFSSVDLADLVFSTRTDVRVNQNQGRNYERNSADDEGEFGAEEPIRGREDEGTDRSGQRAQRTEDPQETALRPAFVT